VTARVSGNFPDSPITLNHIFEIEGGRITSGDPVMLGDLDRLQWKRVVDRLTVMLVLGGTLQFQRAY
jgi:hypothetical protein